MNFRGNSTLAQERVKFGYVVNLLVVSFCFEGLRKNIIRVMVVNDHAIPVSFA